MIKARPTFVCALLILMGSASSLLAQQDAEARKVLEELFGDRLAETAKTAPIKDDIELFAEILPITENIKDRPAVYETAALMAIERLGQKPGGHEIAVQAINGLIKKYPKKWEFYLGKLIEVREHQSKFGIRNERRVAAAAHVACLIQTAALHFVKDDNEGGVKQLRAALVIAKRYRLKVADGINDMLEDFVHIERQAREIEQLKNRLKLNPEDTATAKKLVWIYLLERSDAEEARKYAFLLNDESFSDHVKLATTPVGEIDKDAAMKLSKWYESLSEESTMQPTQKRASLRHAVRYAQRHLDLYKTQDLERVKAEIRLRKLKQAAEAQSDAPDSPTTPKLPLRP